MTPRSWHTLLVTVLPLAAWAALLGPMQERAEVYTWDSAAYIDCARSILDGHGFQQRIIEGWSPEIWQPISWWPPGYPLLIAAFASAGLDVLTSGVAVAIASAAVATILLGWIALRLFHWTVALPLVLSVVLMPAFFQISVTCMSDASYYAFATGSTLLLIRWSQGDRRWGPTLVFAGLTAGLSWGIRNVALSLLAASCLFILMHLAWSDRRRVLAAFGSWAAGASVGLAPFALRNLMVFGALNGYHMPPSELSVGQNLQDTAMVVVHDLTGSSRFSAVMDHPVLLLIGGSLGLGLLGWVLVTRKPTTLRLFAEQHRILLLCVAWAVLHLALVIAARSTYQWGELIGSRHTMQTYWLWWIALGLGALALLPMLGLSSKVTHRVVAAGFALVAVRQAWLSLDYLHDTPPYAGISIARDFGRDLPEVLQREVRRDQIVLAHGSQLLRMYCNVNSRKLPLVAQYHKLGRVTRRDLNDHGRSGLLWGLVIADLAGTERGDYDELIRDITRRPEAYPEFKRIPVDGPAIVLKYVGANEATPGERTL